MGSIADFLPGAVWPALKALCIAKIEARFRIEYGKQGDASGRVSLIMSKLLQFPLPLIDAYNQLIISLTIHGPHAPHVCQLLFANIHEREEEFDFSHLTEEKELSALGFGSFRDR